MKVEFVKSSYTVYEVVKVDNEYTRPRIECTLTCRCHTNVNDFVINGIYGSSVLQNIEERLGQIGYSADFITRVIIGKEFNVCADTVLHEGDDYNETLGRHIVETKARIKVFKILTIFSEELEKYFRKANEEMQNFNNKSHYLFDREKNHLFAIGGISVDNGGYGPDEGVMEPAGEENADETAAEENADETAPNEE